MFLSSSGCTINMCLSFTDDDRPVAPRREKKKIDFNMVDEEDLLVMKNYQKYKRKQDSAFNQ
jgi:hypothetical protein